MIKKTVGICLAISCCLLSLMALAHSNEVDDIKESNKVTANVSVNKIAIANVGSPAELAHKETVEDSLTAQTSLEPVPLLENLANRTANSKPEVGKHVMANMNAGSMLLSLLMVLGLILVCGFVLKRFTLTQQSVSQLKVVTSLRLGAKERMIVVQVGEQQLLLGVTSQQITLLETLSEPLPYQSIKTAGLSKDILSFLSSKKT
ncbi:MAG: flagellar biosynthetic protein FliO [Colwellia sp.]